MSDTVRLKLRRPIKSLRGHSAAIESNSAADSTAFRLLNLESEAEKRDRDRQAAKACLDQISSELSKTGDIVLENLTAVTRLATELGLCLAREIVGEALDKGIVDPTATVLSTLQSMVLSAEDAGIRIAISAEDFSLVVASLQDLPEFAAFADRVEFSVDPTLPRAAVRIETGSGRLQYEPQEVLAKLCDEVRRSASA
ncbi:MAG: FliH/SctL family protein [Planctomycetota bacterium]|jgi:signal transduction histidine kinase